MDLENIPDIFELLDDGDGQVEQDEFIDGMLKMQGDARSSETMRPTRCMTNQNVHFIALEDAFVQNAMETFRGVEGRVAKLHENMNDMIQLTADVVTRLDDP